MRRFIGLAMVAMFGLAGCASNDSARSMESVLGSSTAADDGNETSVVDVVATTLSGESFSLQEALQKKPVVLWFWAPGWGLCNMEAPSVEEASVTYVDAATIVGVAWSGNPQDYGYFVERHELTFANLDDTSGDIFEHFGVAGQPAWAFISQDGTSDIVLGALSEEELEQQIQKLTTQ